jgi:hypothetical protein
VVEKFKKINLTFHFPPASKFSNVAMCIFNVNFGVGVGFYFKLRQEKKIDIFPNCQLVKLFNKIYDFVYLISKNFLFSYF